MCFQMYGHWNKATTTAELTKINMKLIVSACCKAEYLARISELGFGSNAEKDQQQIIKAGGVFIGSMIYFKVDSEVDSFNEPPL